MGGCVLQIIKTAKMVSNVKPRALLFVVNNR